MGYGFHLSQIYDNLSVLFCFIGFVNTPDPFMIRFHPTLSVGLGELNIVVQLFLFKLVDVFCLAIGPSMTVGSDLQR